MYTTLHTACTTNRRPSNLTLKQFIDTGLNLARYLEGHHSIEETHLYPLLARKMPEFRAASKGHGKGHGKGKGWGWKKEKKQEEEDGDCELIRQHRIIHEGMDEMVEYLQRCKNRECELELAVLKEKIEPWGDVLLKHLDQEVRDLGAEKMRRHWTVQEMKSFPI
jgi:hemerythrin-like domain-containing protein